MSAIKKHLIQKLRGQSILVIDPQRELLQDLKSLFDQSSVKVIHSQEQNHAIQIIQDQKPNIVLINCVNNISISSFDGFETSQAIKQLEAYTLIPSIPVILYANDYSNLNKEKYKMSAADSLIVNSINEENIMESLSKLESYKYIIES